MEGSTLILCSLSEVAGMLMIVGGILLVYKQKILINDATGEPTAIELPWGIKVKTNLPAVALSIVGLALFVGPVHTAGAVEADLRRVEVDRIKNPPPPGPRVMNVCIQGSIHAPDYPVIVYAVRAQAATLEPREFRVQVPFLVDAPGDSYTILYRAPNNTTGEQVADDKQIRNGTIQLPDYTIEATAAGVRLPPPGVPYEPKVMVSDTSEFPVPRSQ
jgi:hypothetical protein